MKVLTLVMILFLLLGSFCSNPQSDKTQILVSPKGLVHSFWLSVRDGAEAAGEALDVEIIWKGPSTETDIATQISIVEDYINKRVDAIVLAACDANALVSVIKRANAAGIPVITIDSGVNSDIPKSFVATDNVLAAEKAADALAGLLQNQGEVALIPFVPGAATSIMREQGFKQGLQKYPDMELVAIQYSQSDAERAMAVTEDILTGHPELDGIFAANEAGAIGCASALKSRGVAGEIKLVGFDASPNEIQALKEGTIQALVVQNPFRMGYLGVKAAVDVLSGKPVEKRIDTGVSIVTLENLNENHIQDLLKTMQK
jgi:ribose transport system substrate-binding protein